MIKYRGIARRDDRLVHVLDPEKHYALYSVNDCLLRDNSVEAQAIYWGSTNSPQDAALWFFGYDVPTVYDQKDLNDPYDTGRPANRHEMNIGRKDYDDREFN